MRIITRLRRPRPPPGLLAGAAAEADRTYDLAVALERYATGEDHYPPFAGDVDAEELLARLSIIGQVLSGDVERAGVNALLIEMSMLPIQAPSMRAWATRFPPASTTATLLGDPICLP